MKIAQILKERIMVLDVAMSTRIQQHNLSEGDFRGDRFENHPVDLKGNIDILCLTQSDLIRSIHEEYLKAGAYII